MSNKFRIIVEFDTTDDDNGDAVQQDMYAAIDSELQSFDGGDGLISCTWRIEAASVNWIHLDGFKKE